jgi:DNA polymerase-3 subunit delta'
MVSATPSCDCCAACVQVAGGVHPDYDYVAREANRTDVLIEQVRGLIARLGVRPSRGPRRIAIVDDAETLNLPAQNALLKTLEEPPGDTLIFLISNNERALLDTIRSRTRPVRFAPLNTADVADVLVERAGLKRDQADATARLARGSAGRALQLAEGEGPPTEELLSALKGAGEMDFAKIQTLGQELFGARDQAADNFELIARFLEEMLCCKLLDDAPLSSDRKTADLMNLISQRLKPEQIATLADHALRARAAIDAMANSRLQAEQWWTAASAAMRGE